MELRKAISTTIFLRSRQSDDDTPCCKRPPCWGCVLIFIGIVIAAVLIAILVVITSSGTSDLTTTTEPSHTILTSTASPTTTLTSPTTNPTGTPPVHPETTRPTSTPPVNPKSTTTATTPTTTPPTTPTTTPPLSPMNCEDVYDEGGTTSGVYTIYKDRTTQVQVYCEQTIEGGGWLVFQRRIDGSVNFYRNWYEYKQGFGDAAGEYWLGNDHIYLLTRNRHQKLKVALQHEDGEMVANYAAFWIDDEDARYHLYVSGYSGTHPDGNGLEDNNNEDFSTKDRDNDSNRGRNCAQELSGAWWYDGYFDVSNLNGVYGDEYFRWLKYKKEKLTGATMMMKPK